MESLATEIPQRILMTADSIGGVWTYALELARALKPHGIEIMLATMGSRLNRAQAIEAGAIPNLEIRESNFKLEWMESPWHDVEQAGDWLLQLGEQWQPELVHLNGYSHGALPWTAPVLIVGHSCVLSWWRAVKGEKAPRRYDRYRAEVTRGIHAADLVVAPSEAMLGALELHYGPLKAGEVIPNSRQPDAFQPGEKKDLIFSAGRFWDEGKNLTALTEVAPHVHWPIYIAGEARRPAGPNSDYQNLHALGRLATEELAPWFAQASIYALPARYEPFGLSVLEAGLAGCALVLGDIPSLREIWNHAAIFVPPNDPPALQAALIQLISNRAKLHRQADLARRRAMEFSPQKMAACYLSAYARLKHNHKSISKELATCAS